jgi:hypothetical protein
VVTQQNSRERRQTTHLREDADEGTQVGVGTGPVVRVHNLGFVQTTGESLQPLREPTIAGFAESQEMKIQETLPDSADGA